MRDLFRAFEARGVVALVIGGQAAVLYGAAHFTQDLDLWVRPEAGSLAALLRALADVDARVHKLTPALTPQSARRGHGFHFRIPQPGQAPAYLDVMGCPPRVGLFGFALRRARPVATPWGHLHLVAPEDLVELKKTNRPSDYEVISRLTRIRLAECRRPGVRLLAWAFSNAFRAEDVEAIWQEYPEGAVLAAAQRVPHLRPLCRIADAGRDIPPGAWEQVAERLAHQLVLHLRAGREYWIPRIRELRDFRTRGLLLPEGLPVRELPLPRETR